MNTPGALKWPLRLLVALGVFILLFVYRNFDPDGNHFFPGCLWRRLTGLECAGCGVQRAIHSVLNGQFKTAFFLNAYAFVVCPVWLIWYCVPKLRRNAAIFYSLVASVPLYIVARNVLNRIFNVHI